MPQSDNRTEPSAMGLDAIGIALKLMEGDLVRVGVSLLGAEGSPVLENASLLAGTKGMLHTVFAMRVNHEHGGLYEEITEWPVPLTELVYIFYVGATAFSLEGAKFRASSYEGGALTVQLDAACIHVEPCSASLEEG